MLSGTGRCDDMWNPLVPLVTSRLPGRNKLPRWTRRLWRKGGAKDAEILFLACCLRWIFCDVLSQGPNWKCRLVYGRRSPSSPPINRVNPYNPCGICQGLAPNCGLGTFSSSAFCSVVFSIGPDSGMTGNYIPGTPLTPMLLSYLIGPRL